MFEYFIIGALLVSLILQVMLCVLWLRQRAGNGLHELERHLRAEIAEAARLSRAELSSTLAQQQQVLLLQLQQTREEQALALRRIDTTLSQQIQHLLESNASRLEGMRSTVAQALKEIETQNASKLEEMRRTVDEKLHATLEQRLGASFRSVSERLEQVHRGLGEMQVLAQGVGDLKKVLSNVKLRGTWGEVQLEMLLGEMLTREQYEKNVETIAGSGARVEFAIRLPGRGRKEETVWLPIDAKFPKEQYERLIDAQEQADSAAVAVAVGELDRALRREAKTIAEKYLAPPMTTDFAILFLPTEGLYAEVIRCPGLLDSLQRDCRVTVAGPTTLAALLNSLQMGFRTLALEQRSSEVWSVLSAVKTEFAKFGTVLSKTKETLEKAARHIDDVQTRTRVMTRKLNHVEALPEPETQALFGFNEAANEAANGVEISHTLE